MTRFRRLPRSIRTGLIVLALLAGFAGYVWAQGVGIFSRTLCTSLTAPVSGQTVCFDQTANAWKVLTPGGVWVQSATQTTVNVRDFGAVGDGVTDDTAAIQAALNAACPNGTVVFPSPSASYLHSAALVPPSYCTLVGSSAVIKAKSGTSDQVMGFTISGKTRITLQGLIYDGNRTGRTAGGGPTAFGIFIANSSNITLRDLIVQNSLWDGIELAYTNNADATTRASQILLDNIIVTNSSRNGLTVDGAKDVTCLNSQFNGSDTNSPRAGIDVEADNATIFNESVWFLNCEANGNVGNGLTFAQFTKTSGAIGGRYSGNNGFGIAINTGGAAPDNYGVAVYYPQMENNLLGPFQRLATQAVVNYWATTTAANTISAGGVGGTWPLVPTSTLTNSSIVLRDSAGAFSAGQVTMDSLNIGAGGNNGNLSYSTNLLFLGPGSGNFQLRPGGASGTVVMKSFTGNNDIAAFQVGTQIGNPTGGDKGAGQLNATAIYVNGNLMITASAAHVNSSVTFASGLLNTLTANGMMIYCSDCAAASAFDQTCAGGGTGNLAVRVNGVAKCAF